MCAVINMWCWHLLLVTVVILILINVCCYQHVVLAPTTSNSGYFDIDKCVLLSTCGVAPTTSYSGYFDIDKCVLLSTCGVGTYY